MATTHIPTPVTGTAFAAGMTTTEQYEMGYRDGMYVAVGDPGWEAQLGTDAYEAGYDDGLNLALGSDPDFEAIRNNVHTTDPFTLEATP